MVKTCRDTIFAAVTPVGANLFYIIINLLRRTAAKRSAFFVSFFSRPEPPPRPSSPRQTYSLPSCQALPRLPRQAQDRPAISPRAGHSPAPPGTTEALPSALAGSRRPLRRSKPNARFAPPHEDGHGQASRPHPSKHHRLAGFPGLDLPAEPPRHQATSPGQSKGRSLSGPWSRAAERRGETTTVERNERAARLETYTAQQARYGRRKTAHMYMRECKSKELFRLYFYFFFNSFGFLGKSVYFYALFRHNKL